MQGSEAQMTAQQHAQHIEQMLQQALKIDVNTWPEHRQLNLFMQRRARWLLTRTDKLFPSPRT